MIACAPVLALLACVATASHVQAPVQPVPFNVRQRGYQHEVLFVEVGEQADATRAALWDDVAEFANTVDVGQAAVEQAIVDDAADIVDAFNDARDDLVLALNTEFADIRAEAQAHADELDAKIEAAGDETRATVTGQYDAVDAKQAFETAKTQALISNETNEILALSADIPVIVENMRNATRDVVEAAQGAQEAAELIVELGPEVKEDLNVIVEDFEKIDDFAEAEIHAMRLLVLQQLARFQLEIDDRDSQIRRSLDVLKSGALLNSLLIERNRGVLERFQSSSSSRSSTSTFSSFTD